MGNICAFILENGAYPDKFLLRYEMGINKIGEEDIFFPTN